MPSSIEEEQTDPRIPTITVTNEFAAQLESMRALNDADDDELFLAELMAIHPNDHDIVVEDLEQVDPPGFSDEPEVRPGPVHEHPESPEIDVEEAQEADEALADGVSSLMKVFAVSLSAVASFGRSPSAISVSYRQNHLFIISVHDFILNFSFSKRYARLKCKRNYSQMKLASIPTIRTSTTCRWPRSSRRRLRRLLRRTAASGRRVQRPRSRRV